jgi:hypothetical protein
MVSNATMLRTLILSLGLNLYYLLLNDQMSSPSPKTTDFVEIVGYRARRSAIDLIENTFHYVPWSELHKLAGIADVQLLLDWFSVHTVKDLEDIDARDNIAHWSPLMAAIERVNFNPIKFNVHEFNFSFPLKETYEYKWGNIEERLKLIDVLIDFGANPNLGGVNAGCTPLMVAAEADFVEAIYYLVLKHHVDPNKGFMSHTPLTQAIRGGSVRSVRALIELKADVNRKHTCSCKGTLLQGCTPLHVVAIATEARELDSGQMISMVRHLLNGGALTSVSFRNILNLLSVEMTSNKEFKNEILFARRKLLYYIINDYKYSFLVNLHREISKYL